MVTAHPRQAWIFALAVVCGSAALIGYRLHQWRTAPLPTPELPQLAQVRVEAPRQAEDWDLIAWDKALWRPLVAVAEAAAPPPPPPTPPRVTVFTMVSQGERRYAMLDFSSSGLRKMQAGEQYQEVELTSIHDSHVMVRYRGHDFRLELP